MSIKNKTYLKNITPRSGVRRVPQSRLNFIVYSLKIKRWIIFNRCRILHIKNFFKLESRSTESW